ncbi:hypothetical protein NXX53_00225 [Bacteroides salyersiae]|nr:hypothetical protein [Bacteroides salyersiae]
MKKLFFIACSSFCFSLLLHAQVPGDIENIRFEYMDKPVQSSTGGDPINFIHATYVNAGFGGTTTITGHSTCFIVIRIITVVLRKFRATFTRTTGMVLSVN